LLWTRLNIVIILLIRLINHGDLRFKYTIMAVTDDDIINKFRDMVGKRYDYNQLSERFDLPSSINEDIVNEIKTYFLESIYPVATKRKELEAAFAGLGTYVKSPRKIWGLLGNMSKAIFQFGRHFPTALKAGINGLDAFLGAQKFENEMVDQCHHMEIRIMASDKDFEQAMASLPRKDVDDFIKDVEKLFRIMTNTTLISRTIMILDNVVGTMKKKSHIYPQSEIDGILLGRDILEKGYELFSKYDDKTKGYMVDVIFKNEEWYTNYVFDRYCGY